MSNWFEVVALVVEAFRVAKLAVVPNSVPIVAEVKLAIEAKRVDNTFRLVIDEVAAIREFVLMLVEVELVIVPLVAVREVGLRVEIERLVIVALVIVEFVTTSLVMLAVVIFEVEVLLVVAKVVEA